MSQPDDRNPTDPLEPTQVRPQLAAAPTVKDHGPSTETGLCLVAVLEGGETHRFALAAEGHFGIGRAAENEVCVKDAQISKAHAVLRVGSRITIEDLGSSNGTWVRNERIEAKLPVEIHANDVVRCGSTMLILQPRWTHSRPRRLWSHGYFEGRLEEECARAGRGGHPFGIARVRFDDPRKAHLGEQVLGASVRPADVVARYADCDYELLLTDTHPDGVDEVMRRLSAELAKERIPAQLGVACYPQDGRTPEELVAATSAILRRDESAAGPGPGRIVEGAAFEQMRPIVERIAAGTINVLILGETGVGKEVIAERIHQLSPRAREPLLRINCAAFTDTLLESELFGHERGAFTGAVAAKSGLLETAHHGSVLLDEVGEMPLALQAKLLRVIDERRVLRVGALKSRPIDVRFLSATNRDLDAEVSIGRFRRDLFFRLNGATLHIPPLRERLDELPLLAKEFVEIACQQTKRKSRPVLSPEALARLRTYSWPGNIRELRNVVERAVLLCPDGVIGLEHLPVEKMGPTLSERPLPEETEASAGAIGAREAQRIADALDQCAGNQTRAARLLGISRGTLVSRLEMYSFARPRKKLR